MIQNDLFTSNNNLELDDKVFDYDPLCNDKDDTSVFLYWICKLR